MYCINWIDNHWIVSLFSDDIAEAYNLIKDLEPTTPQEYILKGVVNAALGQEQGSVSWIGYSVGEMGIGTNNLKFPCLKISIKCLEY